MDYIFINSQPHLLKNHPKKIFHSFQAFMVQGKVELKKVLDTIK